MKAFSAAIALTAFLSACGNAEVAAPTTHTSEGTGPKAASAAPTGSGTAARPAASRALADHDGELINPDNSTVVFLYYTLAGVAPPIDDWVEQDTRVRFARPPDKDGQRAAVRAELQAAAAAVRNVGTMRLSLDASLSDYDPTYGEFTVRAFAPSSVINFAAFDQTVSVRFGNGRDAQLWRVDSGEARSIRDRIGYGGTTADARVAITGVQPAPNGGALVVDVIEYELRHSTNGQLIGRVHVGAQ